MASTTYRTGRITAAVAVLVLLGACGSERATPPPEPTAGPPATAELPAPGADEPTDPGTNRPPEVAAAMADLADHLGIAVEDVTVVSYEDVTWPDGALGCPEPGKMYTQAVVEGRRIVLAHDGTEYAYHAGGDRAPFHCADPKPAAD